MFKVKSHSNTYILQQVFVESVFICPKQQYHVCKNIEINILVGNLCILLRLVFITSKICPQFISSLPQLQLTPLSPISLTANAFLIITWWGNYVCRQIKWYVLFSGEQILITLQKIKRVKAGCGQTAVIWSRRLVKGSSCIDPLVCLCVCVCACMYILCTGIIFMSNVSFLVYPVGLSWLFIQIGGRNSLNILKSF